MYVYFAVAYHERLAFLKVGIAANPGDRMADLQTGCPLPLTMLSVVHCKSEKHARRVEKTVHNRLRRYRSSGEWFFYHGEVKRWLATAHNLGGHEICEEDPQPTELDTEYAAIIG